MIDEEYKHYLIGENKLFFPEDEYIIKLSFPRVYIRYKLRDGYFSDFENFFKSIAEVQWIDGEEPEDGLKNKILTEAWNFLALEEQRLDSDLDDLDIGFID